MNPSNFANLTQGHLKLVVIISKLIVANQIIKPLNYVDLILRRIHWTVSWNTSQAVADDYQIQIIKIIIICLLLFRFL